MEEKNNNESSENGKKISPVMAGITGAVIGVGVTAVTAKVLSDKKMRNQIKDTFFDIRHKVSNSISRARQRARKTKAAAERKLIEGE